MPTLLKLFGVFGRLPLLFIVDETLKRVIVNFSLFNLGLGSGLSQIFVKFSGDVNNQEPFLTESVKEEYIGLADIVKSFLWRSALLITSIVSSMILICCPIEALLEVYGCFLGCYFLFYSYQCNNIFIIGFEYSQPQKLGSTNGTDEGITDLFNVSPQPVVLSCLTQVFIVLAFDKISSVGTLSQTHFPFLSPRYLTNGFLLISLALPLLLHTFIGHNSYLTQLSSVLALILPTILLAIHSMFVTLTIVRPIIPVLKNIKLHIRAMDLDELTVSLIEKANNLTWLLAIFFFTKVFYSLLTSKILKESPPFETLNWSEVYNTWTLLASEVLCIMCETILSVMSMASIVGLISSWCLRLVFTIIGARDYGVFLQPALPGFLFVLLAMQTGITGVTDDARLQILFKNCILFLVSIQYMFQLFVSELLINASTEAVQWKRHLRPLLTFIVFFSFPFLVGWRLWQYPFRISWLLEISALNLILIIMSVETLSIYTVTMLHSHTQYLQENLDDLLFYIKAGSGCLEFICSIFLFLNDTYISVFESRGVIHFVLLIMSSYSNIYQSAVNGLATYRQRQYEWQKVNKLSAATKEQLDKNDDICPICYQEMREAVIIKCSHIFHKSCLRKWLSVLETCPLCNTDLKEALPPLSNYNTADLVR